MIDEKQREKLLRHFGGYHEQLYKDALTGAYNRRYFEEKIRKSTVSAGVAMIDLDDFKLYNDSFGHDTGDVVLITFVNIIKNCTRKHRRCFVQRQCDRGCHWKSGQADVSGQESQEYGRYGG